MHKNFQELSETQAVLRAEANTGHVLDENFQLAINDNQKIFTVFENFDVALAVAKSIVEDNKRIECTIFGKDMRLLQFVKS